MASSPRSWTRSTRHPSAGKFTLQVLGAAAEFVRALIWERAKVLQDGYMQRLNETAQDWVPHVRRLRPDMVWEDVLRIINGPCLRPSSDAKLPPLCRKSICAPRVGSWGTQTFIAGLSAEALIAPWIIKGAMDGEAFATYAEQVLVPELEPGTVVILDNLATHKDVAAAEAMRKAGCWFLFLPPYSPDLNPIEMAFSKLKEHLRRIGVRTFTEMFDALSEICDLDTSQECWNSFKAAGYVSG
ncbi:hypothetical protein GTA62_21675 [Roseobacter sp. HKCCD9010]|nr:hypothetical protein [Rhodobacterales bacterium HKCCD4356]NNV14515.1 hypothetical protein [Roseobacter sp. HKCCD7357]NNV18778.1 hypothetical protein [Roseobacter sp. HKCCD8768]NNV28234.1 hypothetical protein [Roseobacter sp. HKCCD8192]NNV32507.1 hypothetical protein [Roseobacter sp. HKCCD9061]NNV36760.1 hypothetical protein [Roseobacter sp. HKCCD9073]NNV40804.1 hypothetical protein [Roseobacter sp. HKCCD9054]NNV45257.1 hypothetical protein [Roseobacter sp. HKCCD6497]NNV49520.1 hypothetic